MCFYRKVTSYLISIHNVSFWKSNAQKYKYFFMKYDYEFVAFIRLSCTYQDKIMKLFLRFVIIQIIFYKQIVLLNIKTLVKNIFF